MFSAKKQHLLFQKTETLYIIKPTKKGISLSMEEWNKLKSVVEKIDKAAQDLE